MRSEPTINHGGPRNAWLRPRRICIVVFALLTISLLSLGAFIQSSWLRARISSTLSSRTDLQVSIGSLSISPFGKLHVSNAAIVDTTQPKPKSSELSKTLTISNLQINPRWQSVFGPTLRIDRIAVTAPQLTVLLQTEHEIPLEISQSIPQARSPVESTLKHDTTSHQQQPGDQKGPENSLARATAPPLELAGNAVREQSPGPSRQPADEIARDRDRESHSTDAIPANDKPGAADTIENTISRSTDSERMSLGEEYSFFSEPPATLPPGTRKHTVRGISLEGLKRRIHVDNFSIEAGSLTCKIAQFDHALLEIKEFGVHLNNLDSVAPDGEITLGGLNILGVQAAEKNHLQITPRDDGGFELSNLHGTILDGLPEAEVHLNLLDPRYPFLAHFNLSGINVSRLPVWGWKNHGKLSLPSGTVDIDITARGFLTNPGGIQISAHMKGRDFTVEGEQFFSTLRANDDIESLKQPLALRALDLAVKNVNGYSVVNDLTIKSDHGILKSRGFLYPNGELEMKGRIYVSAETAHFLDKAKQKHPSSEAFEFSAFGQTTWFTRQQDFMVRGSLWHPTTDFWSPGVLHSVPQLVELFTGRPENNFLTPSLPSLNLPNP